mmetsp:Transcript_21416/g.48334  ORF Transcript_21416/g.48334 Transcript_21416/m.48334 type:complete len:100 (-) Transcript_21416:124-423(-)
MREFLQKEAKSGKLKLPFERSVETLQGRALWDFLGQVADAKPAWGAKVFAMPAVLGTGNQTRSSSSNQLPGDSMKQSERLRKFAGKREVVFYTTSLQEV